MTNCRVYISEIYRGSINLPSYYDGRQKLNAVGRIYLGSSYRQVVSESDVIESKTFVSDGYLTLIETAD